jgi:hypothetical protein
MRLPTETKITAEHTESWIESWIEAVAAGKATMSQRKRSSIDALGGLEAAVAAARARTYTSSN